jgi:hypothetical protein
VHDMFKTGEASYTQTLASAIAWTSVFPQLSIDIGVTVDGPDTFSLNKDTLANYANLYPPCIRYTTKRWGGWIVKNPSDGNGNRNRNRQAGWKSYRLSCGCISSIREDKFSFEGKDVSHNIFGVHHNAINAIVYGHSQLFTK